MVIRPYEPADESAVVQLWHTCELIVPWNDPYKDIQRKLKIQSNMFLVAYHDETLVATVMAGYEGHRGWINYLAVHPDYRKKGLGKRMMDEAELLLRQAGCPKICLQVRSHNTAVIEFYKRIDFEPDDVVSFGKRLESDETPGE